jgi:hypothetical protein
VHDHLSNYCAPNKTALILIEKRRSEERHVATMKGVIARRAYKRAKMQRARVQKQRAESSAQRAESREQRAAGCVHRTEGR